MRDLSKLIEFSTEEGKYSIFKSSYKIRRNFHRLGMDLVMILRIHKAVTPLARLRPNKILYRYNKHSRITNFTK